MKLVFFFFFFSLDYMSWGLKLWGNKSQEVTFPPSTEGLAFLHLWEPHSSTVTVVFLQSEFLEHSPESQVQSHILHLESDKTRMREKCQTQSAIAFSKWFLSLDHNESEEAIMTEKEAISRNLCDFKADDLTLDTA